MTFENKVIKFAKKKHKGQLDDNKCDYYESHLVNVANILKASNADEWTVAAGYLHDVIEDTDTTYKELVSEFGEKIANLVNEVTHEGTKDNIGYYFPRLKTREGIMIKFADNLSNLNRMDNYHKERKQHHLKISKFWKSSPDDKRWEKFK